MTKLIEGFFHRHQELLKKLLDKDLSAEKKLPFVKKADGFMIEVDTSLEAILCCYRRLERELSTMKDDMLCLEEMRDSTRKCLEQKIREIE